MASYEVTQQNVAVVSQSYEQVKVDRMLKIVTEMKQQERDLWEDLDKAWAEVMDLRPWDDTNGENFYSH